MDVAEGLLLHGGVARWSELRGAGVSEREIVAATRAGRCVKVRRGTYCLPGRQDDPMTVAVRLGGVLSCAAAAAHHGLEVFGAVPLHLALRSSCRQPSPRGVVLHRRQVECDSRSTRLHQTLLDCARCLPPAVAVAVLDSALRQGRLDVDELAGLVPRAGPDVARVGRVVAWTDPQAQSVLESAARVLMLQAGLGPVRSQVWFADVGWVDFVVGEWLVVEVDGYTVHREAFAEDRRRDAELARLGLVVLRFTYADVLQRPAWVTAVVTETLDRGRPPFGLRTS